MDVYNLHDTGLKETAIPVTSIEAPAMRKLRLRFREFLVLTVLASLITAAFAIRARTAYQKPAPDHALLAHQIRFSLRSAPDDIKAAKRKMEMYPPISEAWAAGCDVRIMPSSLTDPADIPTEGKNLILVADFHGPLSFRMFDGEGKIAVEHWEGSHPDFDHFRKVLEGLWPPHELTGAEKRWIIASVTSFVNDYRATLPARVKELEAGYAEALAKAEHHERLARRP
jgi:hypothetical protein